MINKENVLPLSVVEILCTDPLFMQGANCPPDEMCPLFTVTSFAEYTCKRCWDEHIKREARDAND